MKNSDWKSILNSKQKCVFNSYIHLKKPTHEMRYSYVNENPIRESVTAIFLDSEGDPAEGYEPFSCELDPGEVVKIDPKALLVRDNFIGSSMLIIRPVNEEDTMIIKNKDAVTSWLAEDTACEIGTAAFPALNTKGVRENQSYYMFCSAVVSDEKRKTLIVIFNHSTDSDYSDTVEFTPKLQNLNGDLIVGPKVFVKPFGLGLFDTDELFGNEGRELLAKTGGRGSMTLFNRGHIFPSFFFHVDRKSENLICGSHTQPAMGIFMNPAAMQHYQLTFLASKVPFSSWIVSVLRKIKNYVKVQHNS